MWQSAAAVILIMAQGWTALIRGTCKSNKATLSYTRFHCRRDSYDLRYQWAWRLWKFSTAPRDLWKLTVHWKNEVSKGLHCRWIVIKIYGHHRRGSVLQALTRAAILHKGNCLSDSFFNFFSLLLEKKQLHIFAFIFLCYILYILKSYLDRT